MADSRNRPQWDSSVVSEELTSPEPIGVGSTMHSRLKAMGREVDFDWRVTEFEKPSRMSITSTAGPLPTALTFGLKSSGEMTQLRATIEGSPAGFMRLAEPMINEAVRANLAGGLGRVKVLLESRQRS